MNKHNFGRLYARSLLCSCLFATCIDNPYPKADDSDDNSRDIMAMTSWDPNNWDKVQAEFRNLRDVALRKDTKNMFNFHLDDAGVQNLCVPTDIDEKRANDKMFNGRFQRLEKRFEIQKAIAPIREKLEEAVANETEAVVYQNDIDDVMYVTIPRKRSFLGMTIELTRLDLTCLILVNH